MTVPTWPTNSMFTSWETTATLRTQVSFLKEELNNSMLMAPLKATLFLNKMETYMEDYKLCTKVKLDIMLPLINFKFMPTELVSNRNKLLPLLEHKKVLFLNKFEQLMVTLLLIQESLPELLVKAMVKKEKP